MKMNVHSIHNRVNQLHSALLDDELFENLIPSIQKINHLIQFDRFNLEFITLLKTYWIASSLLRLNPSTHYPQSTLGSKLSNLKFKSNIPSTSHPQFKSTHQNLTSNQIKGYIILSILPSYLNSRLRDYMLSSSWSDYTSTPNLSSLFSTSIHSSIRKKYWFRFIWDSYNLLDQFISTLKFINFSFFLFNGQYRSLIERLLKIQLIPDSINLNQNLSFEFLNRQLVWESITDFILFILPFINLKRTKLKLLQIKSNLSKFLIRKLSLRSTSTHPSNPSTSQPIQSISTQFQSLPRTSCPICTYNSNLQNPFNNLNHQIHQSIQLNSLNLIQDHQTQVKVPYMVNCCDGLYCYTCILNSILNHRASHLNQNWECWRCGKIVTSLKRYKA
ncbi:Pex12 amino terminal region-domain-containing protein [Melampsora americana]|nr:Pex12 amino terminal region-domain-containing protein [Melampsora americana]